MTDMQVARPLVPTVHEIPLRHGHRRRRQARKAVTVVAVGLALLVALALLATLFGNLVAAPAQGSVPSHRTVLVPDDLGVLPRS